jgi:hypothetical protein
MRWVYVFKPKSYMIFRTIELELFADASLYR